jgi:hypothetical protein
LNPGIYDSVDEISGELTGNSGGELSARKRRVDQRDGPVDRGVRNAVRTADELNELVDAFDRWRAAGDCAR